MENEFEKLNAEQLVGLKVSQPNRVVIFCSRNNIYTPLKKEKNKHQKQT